MSDRVFDTFWKMWQKEKSVKERTGSELAEIIGEEEILASMKEYRDGKCIGPFDSAADALRSMLED
jgi:hypothetical protein